MRWLVAILLAAPCAAGPAGDVARALREGGFDRSECYRVRDLTLVRGDIRIYLTDGHLLFSRPVEGRRVAAVFSADVQGGDAEVIIMPPTKGERRSLAAYIGSPNLNEHFKSAIFLSAGDLHAELTSQMSANPANRKLDEMAPLMESNWGDVLRNLTQSYEARLTLDVLNRAGPREAFFSGIFSGSKVGNFDVMYDPRAVEQVNVGQVVSREGRTFFDIWTSFAARNSPRRDGDYQYEITLKNYRIEATIEPDLNVSAVTRVKATPRQSLRVLSFDVAREMRLSAVTIDGVPAEFLQTESLRGNLGRAGNQLFLVAPSQPLQAGREYEIEFRHAGRVIHDAGDRVYYVLARGNWYPAHGLQYATFDMTFRYSRDLDLVSAGEVVEDKTEGERRMTRRRTLVPVRLAGFNLGSYQHARAKRGPYVVEVYANRSLEQALQPKPSMAPVTLPDVGLSRRRPMEPHFPVIVPGPSPTGQMQRMAGEVADALEYMAARFGPPAMPYLTVSPIPGTFGQGFPGLIYLSTLSYMKGTATVSSKLTTQQEVFYTDILQAHETAHQWWGNVVSASGYHDYWLMEALANYSALLFLEKQKGSRLLEQALDQYRNELLAKNDAGQMVDEAGPIVLGTRLESSIEPKAWRAITYGKGSWIIHMLRGLMGDERFFKMLAELRRKFEHREITTEAFRRFAAGFLPPKSEDPNLEAFFDQWVYNTGIPSYKLSHSVKRAGAAWRVTGTVTQSGVGGDFTALVPVEMQLARGKVVHWVRVGSEPAPFSVPLKAAPVKVLLDPHAAVLRK
jgi:hypothetical protein